MSGTIVPSSSASSASPLDDFHALLAIAQTDGRSVGTSDVYGGFRPGGGKPDFPNVRGNGRFFTHQVEVPDMQAPQLTMPANLHYGVMAVQEPGCDSRSTLALSMQIQWTISTGKSECTRSNYVIREDPACAAGYSIAAYWWQLSTRHVGRSFTERLADAHRAAYFTLVINDLLQTRDPRFAMLSAGPVTHVDPAIVAIMRRQIEQDLATG